MIQEKIDRVITPRYNNIALYVWHRPEQHNIEYSTAVTKVEHQLYFELKIKTVHILPPQAS